MKTFRNSATKAGTTLVALALLMVTVLVAAGCGSSSKSSSVLPTEEALRERVAGYWNLRLKGETIRRYQDYMAAAYKEGRDGQEPVSLEEYVRKVSGAAIFTGFEIKQIAIQEADEETGEILAHVHLEYDWHINPSIANVTPTSKTAPLETIWIFEEGEWRRWREATEEESILLNADPS